MVKAQIKKIFALLLFSGIVFSSSNIEQKVVAQENLLATTSIDDYYSSLYDTSGNLLYKGKELRSKLHDIISYNTTNKGYGDLSWVYKTTDVDTNNSNNVILYYSGESRSYNFTNFSGTINREHVWCQSHFGSTTDKQNSPYSDAHQVRPCDSSLNSWRNNSFYSELTPEQITKKDDYGNASMSQELFYPSEEYRGDVARTLFYVATRYYNANSTTLNYDNLDFVDAVTSVDAKSYPYQMGNISSLMKWNILYQPSELEIRRNDEVEKIQNNRNPFIDHPEYAVYIWEDFNSNTQSIVNQYTYEVSFDTMGGTLIDNQKVLYNSKALKPVDPTKNSASFLGWFTEKECVNEFDFITPITSDIVLYAKWLNDEPIVTTPIESFSSLATKSALGYSFTRTSDENSSGILYQNDLSEAAFSTNGTKHEATGYYYSTAISSLETDTNLSFENGYRAKKGLNSDDYLLKMGSGSKEGKVTIQNSLYSGSRLRFKAVGWKLDTSNSALSTTTLTLTNATYKGSNTLVIAGTLTEYILDITNSSLDVIISGTSSEKRYFIDDIALLGTGESWEFSNFYIKYKMELSKTLFQDLNVNTFGCLINVESNLPTNPFKDIAESEFNNYVTNNKFLNLNIQQNQMEEDIDNYILKGSVTNIPSSALKNNLTGVFYVVYQGRVYFNSFKTCSVENLVNTYLADSSGLSDIQLNSLKALKEQL